jgi:lysosomal acid phosphatase
METGPLIGEMVSHMKQKALGALTPDRKLFVYSAHDTTVANVLMTLGVFDTQTPSYTSSILIELHQLKSTSYAVSVYVFDSFAVLS